MSKAKEYKLYICTYSRENEAKYSGNRFMRITTDYVLVYSDKPVEGMRQVEPENAYLLDIEEKKWLLDCNTVILAEDAKENEARYSHIALKALRELQKEFEKSKKE